MTGNSTKYKNTTRIISGATNFVFENDVVLLCDTSLGVVDLTLLDIPSGNFSTQYKLYIVDKSNNASANNITIKAPTGTTVNNSATAVLNVNSGVAVITISSNTTYNVQFNYSVSGNPLIIKNEGVQITPSATSIDFVGTPVTATAVGNDVTVTIALGFTSVTYATLQTLIGSNSLIPTQQYLITDAIFVNTAPIEQVAILVTAVSTNEISLSGSGIFLNADYQGVGNYSAVTGFVTQTGIYSISGTYAIGEAVVYDNLNYVNISGANTGFPNSTPLDWSLLTKTSTNGYITEIDDVLYNVATNQITYRQDVRNNRIENNLLTYTTTLFEAFKYFQWGNNNVTENTISRESYWDIINQSGTIFGNLVDNLSAVTKRAYNQGTITNNQFVLKSTVLLGENLGTIEENVFESVGDLTIVQTFVNTFIRKNIFRFGTCCTISNNADLGVIQCNEFIHNLICETPYEIDNFGGTINDNRFYQCTLVRVSNNTGQIDNNSLEQDATMDININTGSVYNNSLTQGGALRVTGKPTTNNSGNISYNMLNGGLISVDTENTGDINQNLVENEARITVTTNESLINSNVINKSNLLLVSNLSEIESNTIVENSLVELVNVTASGTIVGNRIKNSNVTLSTNFGVDFSGSFNQNVILDSLLTFNKGVDSGGSFELNELSAKSKFTATEILTGIVVVNTFINSAWTFKTLTISGANISKNALNSTTVTTDFIANSFQGNILNNCNWLVATNTGRFFNQNNWTAVDFTPTSVTADLILTNITNATFTCPSFNINVEGGIIQNGIGTTLWVLDLSDPAVYNVIKNLITIPTCLSTFFGVYELINVAGKNVDGVVNSSDRFPTRFVNGDTGTIMDFRVLSGIATAPTESIVSSDVGAYPILYRVANNFGVQDYIVIKRSIGDINCIEEHQHYV
jgi:hypothetical protein